MQMNPTLKKMGFSEKDKVAIIHADDVGLNLSSIDAFLELVDFGTISCGSAMAPCSWFPEVAKVYKENPNLDIGLHLGLNCEYPTYRWRPISTMDSSCGFIDENGYFKQNAQEVMSTADPKAAAIEIKAQIDLAYKLGLNPTHVDPHAATLMSPTLIDAYIDIPLKEGILPVLMNFDRTMGASFMAKDILKDKQHLPEEQKNQIRDRIVQMVENVFIKVDEFKEKDIPCVDNVTGLPVNEVYDIDDRIDLAKKMISSFPEGKLTHFAFHPLKDTAESRGLNRFSEGRIGDFRTFISPEIKNHLKNEGIQVIGYKEILKFL